MQHYAYFLISQKPSLEKKLMKIAETDAEFGEIYAFGPVLWGSEMGGFSVETLQTHLDKIKMLYLADLYQILRGERGFSQLFDGDFRIAVETFDGYWNIETYEVDRWYHETLGDLEPETIEMFDVSGNEKLQQWLNWILESIQNQS